MGASLRASPLVEDRAHVNESLIQSSSCECHWLARRDNGVIGSIIACHHM